MILEWIFPRYLWKVPTAKKVIYLTFDDGPIPEVTPWVLEQLAAYHAKATFFCVGDNIRKHPETFQSILDAGHSVGNHTFHHINGWKTPLAQYLEDIEKFDQMYQTPLFRPPYGRIKRSQADALLPARQIVMWSVLTRDYDASYREDSCLNNAIKRTSPGAIVLLHDSLKAWKNMSYVLPRYLKHFSEKGYRFEALP